MHLWPTFYTFKIRAYFHNASVFAGHNIYRVTILLIRPHLTFLPAFYFFGRILLFSPHNDHHYLHTQKNWFDRKEFNNHLAQKSLMDTSIKFLNSGFFINWKYFRIKPLKMLPAEPSMNTLFISECRPQVHKNTYAPLILKDCDIIFLILGKKCIIGSFSGFFEELLTFWPLNGPSPCSGLF